MKNILLAFICLFFIACNKDKVNNTNKLQNSSSFDYNTLDDTSRFYLLVGKADENNTKIYLTISKDMNNLISISGRYYDLPKGYIINGKVADEGIVYLEFLEDFKQESKNIYSFKGKISQDGTLSGVFIDDKIQAKGTKALFSPASDKINQVVIANASYSKEYVGKDYDGSDRKYIYNSSKQGALILNPQTPEIIQINNIIGSGAKDANELKTILFQNLQENDNMNENFNYESISNINVDYIDDKIIGFENYIYEYRGGAHGSYANNMIYFSLENAKELSNNIKDLIKDENDKNLKNLIMRKFNQINFTPQLVNNDDIALSSFRILDNGVEFYWGIYEIASYADGIISIHFDFNELKPFIRQDSPYYYLFAIKL